MKSLNVLVFCTGLIATYFFAASAVAEENGEAIFNKNCGGCHAGGKNIIETNKTLSKAHLQENERFSLEAIQNIVKNGYGAMPSFSGQLDEADIKAVAQYVMDKATEHATQYPEAKPENGWQP